MGLGGAALGGTAGGPTGGPRAEAGTAPATVATAATRNAPRAMAKLRRMWFPLRLSIDRR
jgi:hypothetical protein